MHVLCMKFNIILTEKDWRGVRRMVDKNVSKIFELFFEIIELFIPNDFLIFTVFGGIKE